MEVVGCGYHFKEDGLEHNIMKEMTINTIHWSKYLDETKNPRVKNFLKHRGDDVMWQVAQNVHKSGNGGKHDKDRLVMLIHENAPYAINIPRSEYDTVLDLSLKYFEKKEDYEKCAEIVTFKKNIKNKPYSNKQKPIKNLI
jgi:hypothetical protein